MTRRYLGEEARGRFADARIEAIRRLGAVARDQDCSFVAVCGDVFESNHVDRRTIVRAVEAMADVGLPVVLLPGNHDPLDGASVFDTQAFRSTAPERIHVLRDGEPFSPAPGIEVVGAPWSNKHPGRDLVAEMCAGLEPAKGVVRIALAHGAVDALSPDRNDPARIELAGVERALADGRIHFLALGDRHSLTEVGSSGRVFYAGSPEPTDFDEVLPGQALVVNVDAQGVETAPHPVSTWHFVRKVGIALDAAHDLDGFESWLDGLPDKARSVLRLGFEGTLDLRGAARLEATLAHAGDLFAAVTEHHSDLAVLPDDADFDTLSLSGFASAAVERLRDMAAEGEDGGAARDALALLVRLAGNEETLPEQNP
jgi:DNA repair exonuclease SbcCD nuclease subunit